MRRLVYYIYYRVSAAHDARAFQAVRQAQAEVAATTGARARLLEKRDEADLWMEVYEGITDADIFERELTAAVGRHGLTGILHAGASRKTEIFIDAPCA